MLAIWPFKRSEQAANAEKSDHELLRSLVSDVAEMREDLDNYLRREKQRLARERMAAKRAIEQTEVVSDGEPEPTRRKGSGGLLRRA